MIYFMNVSFVLIHPVLFKTQIVSRFRMFSFSCYYTLTLIATSYNPSSKLKFNHNSGTVCGTVLYRMMLMNCVVKFVIFKCLHICLGNVLYGINYQATACYINRTSWYLYGRGHCKTGKQT